MYKSELSKFYKGGDIVLIGGLVGEVVEVNDEKYNFYYKITAAGTTHTFTTTKKEMLAMELFPRKGDMVDGFTVTGNCGRGSFYCTKGGREFHYQLSDFPGHKWTRK